MSHGFFATVFYIPFYNAFVFLSEHFARPQRLAWCSNSDLGDSVHSLSLFPKPRFEPRFDEARSSPRSKLFKETVKDRNEQGKQTFELYRKKGVNPFAGFFWFLFNCRFLSACTECFGAVCQKLIQHFFIVLFMLQLVFLCHFLGQ
jgi:hypothetical protein